MCWLSVNICSLTGRVVMAHLRYVVAHPKVDVAHWESCDGSYVIFGGSLKGGIVPCEDLVAF